MIRSRYGIVNLGPSSTRFPVQALTCSFLLHTAFILFIIWLGPINWWPTFQPSAVKLDKVEINHENYVLTLPALGPKASGSEPGAGTKGRRASRAAQGARAASASSQIRSIAGLIFQGPQQVVSNPLHPDNFVQTIRQPDLIKPPSLRLPIPSQNILQTAPSAPFVMVKSNLLDPKAKLMKPSERIPVQAQPIEIVQPKLTLPISGESATHALSAVVNPTAVPKFETPRFPGPIGSEAGEDVRNLLVLNAVPSQALPLPQIPPGELSGAFSVSPTPSNAANVGNGTSGAGSGASPTGATAGANGSGANSGAGSAAGHGSDDNGSGNSGKGEGAGSGSAPGNGNGGTGGDVGKGSGASGTGTGATGSGPGSGSGTGPGSAGNGAGNSGSPTGQAGPNGGSGKGNPFPDVSISATAHTSTVAMKPPRLAPPHQTYGMTIVATSSTGGGLKDYGVFKNETVNTVYMDMNEPGHSHPNWTLQYASIAIPGDPPPSGAVLVPPFPDTKEYPQLPPEIVTRNIGRMIIATGIISKDGKLGTLRVIQSPNPLMIEPILANLAKWIFQAAELNGEPVPVKVLLGIPISVDLAGRN